jgi:hypothetical protein
VEGHDANPDTIRPEKYKEGGRDYNSNNKQEEPTQGLKA